MPLDSQGACLVLGQNTVSGLQALHATFLLQTLLLEYETLGSFAATCALPLALATQEDELS